MDTHIMCGRGLIQALRQTCLRLGRSQRHRLVFEGVVYCIVHRYYLRFISEKCPQAPVGDIFVAFADPTVERACGRGMSTHGASGWHHRLH